MNILRVVGWEEHFESAKSKTYAHKSQAYMPNKHGLGYRRLVDMPNGPALFGAWCSMVQVLSRQAKPRQGYLTDTGSPSGRPFSASDIALLTSMSESLVSAMLQATESESVGWLKDTTRTQQGYQKDTSRIIKSSYEGEGEGEGNGEGGGKGYVSGKKIKKLRSPSGVPVSEQHSPLPEAQAQAKPPRSAAPPAEPVATGGQPGQISLRRGDQAPGGHQGTGQGGDRPACAKPAPAAGPGMNGGWVAKAVEIWSRHIGVVAYGKMGALLKPACDKVGETVLLAALERYCTSDARRFGPTPARFVERIAMYIQKQEPTTRFTDLTTVYK